jgi:hypothetical protein
MNLKLKLYCLILHSGSLSPKKGEMGENTKVPQYFFFSFSEATVMSFGVSLDSLLLEYGLL